MPSGNHGPASSPDSPREASVSGAPGASSARRTLEIDGLQFARDQSHLEGVAGPDRLPRLAELGGSTQGVEFRLEGVQIGTPPRPLLRVELSGEVLLTCQRCLEDVAWPIETASELELCEDSALIDAAEDDVDRVLATKSMNVFGLIEDELILALPMVARHEACEPPAGAAPDGVAADNPWAALARRKT